MDDDSKAPNKKLKQERELRGWSQEKLAELVGTGFENVSRWERGVTFPQPHFREKLCALFGKNAAELGLVHSPPVESENDDKKKVTRRQALSIGAEVGAAT